MATALPSEVLPTPPPLEPPPSAPTVKGMQRTEGGSSPVKPVVEGGSAGTTQELESPAIQDGAATAPRETALRIIEAAEPIKPPEARGVLERIATADVVATTENPGEKTVVSLETTDKKVETDTAADASAENALGATAAATTSGPDNQPGPAVRSEPPVGVGSEKGPGDGASAVDAQKPQEAGGAASSPPENSSPPSSQTETAAQTPPAADGVVGKGDGTKGDSESEVEPAHTDGKKTAERTTAEGDDIAKEAAEREELNQVLAETGKLLYELKRADSQVLMIATARLSGNTPLADEYRRFVVESMRDNLSVMSEDVGHLSEESVKKITELRDKLGKYTPQKIEGSHFEAFLKTHHMEVAAEALGKDPQAAMGVWEAVMEGEGGAAAAADMRRELGVSSEQLSAEKLVSAATGEETPDKESVRITKQHMAQERRHAEKEKLKTNIQKLAWPTIVGMMVLQAFTPLMSEGQSKEQH